MTKGSINSDQIVYNKFKETRHNKWKRKEIFELGLACRLDGFDSQLG